MSVLDELVGECPAMLGLRQRVESLLRRHALTRQPRPILIQGETGTGKGLLARLIHRAGPRPDGAFVDVNCAAIPEPLLEAELFGYERGAFTDARQGKPGLFQTAHGGTLFLDEIGLLPIRLQAKLLKAVEEGSVRRLGATRAEAVSASILVATNEDLRVAIREGRFREDLYHRLAVLTLDVPPLRERGTDIDRLADRFLSQACAAYGLPVKTLDRSARTALRAHAWPGNVRELHNVIERAALLSDARNITVDMLGLKVGAGHRVDDEPIPAPARQTERLADRERLEEALQRTGWNISRTAAALGITRNTVRAWIERYRLQPRGNQAARPAIAPARAEAPAPARHARVRWERRRVTFLRVSILTDDVDSTLTATRVLQELVDKVASFGGRVDEVSRTGVVGIFGFDPAEDAARRAANCAVAILNLIERDQAEGRLTARTSLALGLHTTQGLVTHIGAIPRLDQEPKAAAWTVLDRVVSLSRQNILVSDAGAALLRRHFLLRRAGEGVHQLMGRGTNLTLTPFLGRKRDVELLTSRIELAHGGHGQVVSIVGEPGIGKSRLLRELDPHLPDDVVILEGRCASYASHVPYFPVVDILHTVCRIQEFDPPERIAAKVLAILEPLGPGAVARAPYVQHLLHPQRGGGVAAETPATVKARTFEALQELVIAQQTQGLVLILIEDLQWIDKTSEDLLASLVELAIGARLMIVTTFRHGYRAPWSGRSHVSQIALGPLSTEDSRRLVQSVLNTVSPEPVVATILARAEGNPFFLEELARAVGEQQDPLQLHVPDTVHDVLAARIAHLSESDRAILRRAAVIGRDVPLALLADVSDVSPEDLASALDRLRSAEFLYPTRLGSEPEYTFKHALTHDVAYNDLLESERRAVHGRVAVAIEKLAPETRERQPERLARRYTEAGRPGEAIGYWHRAGQLAMQRSAHTDAIAHLTTGLALIERQPPSPDRDIQEIMLQLSLGASQAATQGYGAPGLEHTLARTRELTERLGESVQLVAARWALYRFYLSRAEFREAEDLAIHMVGSAERQSSSLLLLAARGASGIVKFYRGDLASARRELEEAARMHAPADSAAQIAAYGQDLGVAAVGFLGWALAVMGDVDGAAELADRALALGRAANHSLSLALALLLAGEVRELRREPDAVGLLGRELLALAREHSLSFFTSFGLMFTGWATVASGQPDGIAMMREGADLFRAVGQRVGLAHRAHLAEALIAVGEADQALAIVAEALQQSERSGEGAFAGDLHRLRGEALQALARQREAELSFREAIDVASRQGAWLFALRAATSLVRLGASDESIHREACRMLDALIVRFPPTLELEDFRMARALLRSTARTGDSTL
jgi:transcriptional regulator with AAA-type ATPase domain/tetratricopeptide (TPR) repeat protein